MYDRKFGEFIHYAKLHDKILCKTYEQVEIPLNISVGTRIIPPSLGTQEQVDLRPPPSDLALGRFVRRVLVNGHLVEFVHLVGSVERGFELRARGIGAH